MALALSTEHNGLSDANSALRCTPALWMSKQLHGVWFSTPSIVIADVVSLEPSQFRIANSGKFSVFHPYEWLTYCSVGTAMPGKILIVEDNSALSEIFSICLHNAGYETSWARNSAQGISKALAERPDLILTDLTLPDMTAVEAATILKKDPITSAIPIIVLTGIYGREWKTKALKAGAAEYMTKPVSLLHLTQVISRLCPQPSVIAEL